MPAHTDIAGKGDLIARLESASEGSRELDAEVCAALGHHPGFPDGEYTVPWRVDADEGALVGYIVTPDGDQKRWKRPPASVTTSLDAALALAERVLPGRHVTVGNHHDFLHGKAGPNAIVSQAVDAIGNYDSKTVGYGFAATLPLALCIAILRARGAAQ